MPCSKCVCAALLCLFSVPARGQPHADAAIIGENIAVGVPLAPCAVPAVVTRIARAMRVPLGLEPVPELCVAAKPAREQVEELALTGLSVRAALDRLVELDPRYQWLEADGVLVMRPLAAWNDRDHFLHRTLPSFRVRNQNVGGALDALMTALGPYRFGGGQQMASRTAEGDQHFSISLGATSILEAFNAVARTHGALWWTVRYCQLQARYEFATLYLNTFDGSSLGSHAIFLRHDDGKTHDPCAGGARP